MGQFLSTTLLKPEPVCLRAYIEDAILPQLTLDSGAPSFPPNGSRSRKNALHVPRHVFRKLECMQMIIPTAFDRKVSSCKPSLEGLLDLRLTWT
jgi:hypothetical protein